MSKQMKQTNRCINCNIKYKQKNKKNKRHKKCTTLNQFSLPYNCNKIAC